MEEKNVVVTNILRFSLHDGPGIRTTVFFKGCNLRCPWCSNPENINFEIENYTYGNEQGIYGYRISLEELFNEVMKDKEFYEDGGGVTFSGGECLFQMERIEPLLKKLKEKNMHICIETALTVPKKFLEIALKYVDLFYVDMKILDENLAKKINGNTNIYIENLQLLDSSKKNYIIRIPLVNGYTYTDKNINEIMKTLNKIKPIKVEIFKIHNLAQKKYETLQKEMFKEEEISNEQMQEFKEKIENIKIKCDIIKI